MKAGHAALVALAAAVTLTSVAAAGPAVAKQRVAITTQATRTTSVSLAVFTPLQAGALKPDSGSLVAPGGTSSPKVVVREGQGAEIYTGPATFKGKRGTIALRIRQEYVEAGNGLPPRNRHVEGRARHRCL